VLLLVWVELVPLTFWLDPVAMVEKMLLVGCCNLTSKMSPKAACSRPSTMVEIFWVGDWFWAEVWLKASSLGRERRWLILKGGIIRVVFELKIWWMPNVET
jgi:hypothetical protein